MLIPYTICVWIVPSVLRNQSPADVDEIKKHVIHRLLNEINGKAGKQNSIPMATLISSFTDSSIITASSVERVIRLTKLQLGGSLDRLWHTEKTVCE